jgi:hypothetical protein
VARRSPVSTFSERTLPLPVLWVAVAPSGGKGQMMHLEMLSYVYTCTSTVSTPLVLASALLRVHRAASFRGHPEPRRFYSSHAKVLQNRAGASERAFTNHRRCTGRWPMWRPRYPANPEKLALARRPGGTATGLFWSRPQSGRRLRSQGQSGGRAAGTSLRGVRPRSPHPPAHTLQP